MSTTIEISEDAFAALFRPIANHLNANATCDWGDGYGTLFETYGEDLAFIQTQPPEKVWTWVSGDDGDYITSGFHFVNRVGYFVTSNSVPEGVDIQVALEGTADPLDFAPPPRTVSEALWAVLNYLWEDEQRHYLESNPEVCTSHIYQSLDIIHKWLKTI